MRVQARAECKKDMAILAKSRLPSISVTWQLLSPGTCQSYCLRPSQLLMLATQFPLVEDSEQGSEPDNSLGLISKILRPDLGIIRAKLTILLKESLASKYLR
jgi:hypothetical protein